LAVIFSNYSHLYIISFYILSTLLAISEYFSIDCFVTLISLLNLSLSSSIRINLFSIAFFNFLQSTLVWFAVLHRQDTFPRFIKRLFVAHILCNVITKRFVIICIFMPFLVSVTELLAFRLF